jgi:hypothetical protein
MVSHTDRSKTRLKPGEIVTDSGIYEDVQTGQRATLVKGEHAPPTQEAESAWQLILATHT